MNTATTQGQNGSVSYYFGLPLASLYLKPGSEKDVQIPGSIPAAQGAPKSDQIISLFTCLAIIWGFMVTVGRGVMVQQRMDHQNTGFLPVLIGIGEWFSIFDISWVVCYTDHRLRTSAPRIDFEAHFSEDGILQGSPTASLLWLEMSCLDAIYGIGSLLQLFCDTIRARMSHQEASQSGVVHDAADGNGHSDDNAIPMETWATGGPVDMTNTPTDDGPVSNSFNRVWNKTGLWLRGWLALARVATVLEWKYMFKFAPASSQENLEAGGVQGSIPERLPDIQYPRVHHLFSDDQEEQNRLNDLMRTSDRLLLVYGPYIMEIHNSKKAQVPPLQDLKFKATARLVFLLTLSISGLMTKSRTWACGFLILLVPLLLHSRIEKQSEVQREFFNKVSECSREIERTSRYLHGKYVEPQHTYWAQRPFDVLLRYNGVMAWCRYSPVPPGEENERQSGNTWIELVIPSTSSKCNRVYKFIDCAAHSFLPWGHCDNWDVNIVYA
ncbi:hypothetical protein BDV32DRAFT_148311 [Aspergillus pseudonomiae]|uniref:Uncharacterized protein n=1 Tax=Aspergillus pseudonomiae TaxID=1506151 RepID=A0A5N7DLN6_9EURO|nr:uncharacterized protein BDV37DRAFT_280509 [Aspergillus pseudonomiae]KAB8261665.1 hypothetical protein BDV32DRAFT_148311 [Aspergillus pseudonomiae]KAE8406903.1 hypothetical protein BDV37DRAFT_280509 [Aspergillus pseudonomiae]